MLLLSRGAYYSSILTSSCCGGCSGTGEKVNKGDLSKIHSESGDACMGGPVVEDARRMWFRQMGMVRDEVARILATPRWVSVAGCCSEAVKPCMSDFEYC